MEGQEGHPVFDGSSEDSEEVHVNCFQNGKFCGRCCFDTEMPLTDEDIRRIESLGYRREDFSVKDGKVTRLRNVSGRCYFLDSENRCRIYPHRPEGCRLYPAVLDGGRVVVDKLCPRWREVVVTKGVERRVLKLVKRVYGTTFLQ